MALSISRNATAELTNCVSDLMPTVRRDLMELIRIQSVNFPGFDHRHVEDCARTCVDLLKAAGATDVGLVYGETGVPTVRADVPGPPGSPTVVLYSHYDVQPSGPVEAWDSAPFEPQEREGRLYGRGAADDKSGVVSHIATVAAFAGQPPVSLRILLEGEEEGGGEFEEWPNTRPDVFADAAVALIADMGNVKIGKPTFTTQLRGIVEGIVTIRTLTEPRHSGQFGGPLPDALMVMIELLGTLQDSDGNCQIEGIPGSGWQGADVPEDVFRSLAGVEDGVPLVGEGSIASRLYSKPAVSVVGLDAPPVDTAPNAIIPMARAKISVRIPAGVDGEDATAALERHVVANVPFGIKAEFEAGLPANGCEAPVDGVAYNAYRRAMEVSYGHETTTQGVGGAVPFMANLIEAFPDLEVISTGAQDPPARIHAPNESVDLAELNSSILAQVLFLAEYAEHTSA
jgi:acetylornithine deacetylase/succinyl-diaminopimelate desuccinylase-like protein